MGKIEEKKRKKEEALLESAFQLFTEKGIDNTSISDIAKNAQMAKGTFYLYFKDKNQIQDRLIRREANLIFERANHKLSNFNCEKAYDSVEDCVINLVGCVIDELVAVPSILRFISKNLSWAVFSNIRIAGLDNQNCMDIFDRLLQSSKKKFRQKELMIYMIVELVNSTCYNVILHDMPVRIEEFREELYCTIRGILRQFECKGEQTLA